MKGPRAAGTTGPEWRMATYGVPSPARSPKPPGPSARLSIILIVAGALVGIAAFVVAIVPIVRVAETKAIAVPTAGTTLHLGTGSYMVYEHTGSPVFGDLSGGSTTLGPGDITITSASGAPVPLAIPSASESITHNGRSYTGVARFSPPAAGDYTLRITATSTDSVIVARPLTSLVARALGWFALSGLGGLTFVAGIVMLVVGIVRRGRAGNAYAFAVPQTPAGWYGDPHGSGRLRYWDGTRWTEHLH